MQHLLVHTGQHYDKSVPDDFFVQLGIPEAKIYFVGNVMIDNLIHCLGKLSNEIPYPGLKEKEFAVITIH